MKSKNWSLKQAKKKRNHRKSNRLIKSMFILHIITFITAYIALGGRDYIHIFKPNWSASVPFMVIHWLCTVWRWTSLHVEPLIIFCYIFRNIYILDDVIGLKKEIKDIAIRYFFISMLFVIFEIVYGVTVMIGFDVTHFWPIVNMGFLLVIRVLYVPINQCRF